MKKIRLEVGELSVESFTTHADPPVRGTINGHFTAVDDGCVYPTPSCQPGETYGEFSCFCLYPRTDERICCNSDIWCTNTCRCGGGSGYTCDSTCGASCYESCGPAAC